MIEIELVPIPERKTASEILTERVDAINAAFSAMQIGQSIFIPDSWGVPGKALRPPPDCYTRALRVAESDAGAVFDADGAFVPGVRHFRVSAPEAPQSD